MTISAPSPRRIQLGAGAVHDSTGTPALRCSHSLAPRRLRSTPCRRCSSGNSRICYTPANLNDPMGPDTPASVNLGAVMFNRTSEYELPLCIPASSMSPAGMFRLS